MGIKVKVDGLDKLRASLAETDSEVRRAATRAVDEELDDLAQDMKRGAPVGDRSRGRRGDPPLAESIVTTRDGLKGSAGPRVLHAVFVEHGTSSHSAEPFVLPAAERSRRRFPNRVGAEVRKAVE